MTVTTPHSGQKVAELCAQCVALQREIDQLLVLQHISQDLVSEVTVDRLLHRILRAAIEVMQASAGSLILLDPNTDELVFRVVEGGGGAKLQDKRMPRHQGIAGWVIDHQEAVIIDDTVHDRRFNADVGASVDYAVTSMICAPMTARGKALGVLQILNKHRRDRFEESDKALLLAFAAQSAIAIRNAQLYRELREERDRIVAVEEDVRKELARDLHDGPTQLVAAIMMNLEFVYKLLKRSPDKIRAELDEIQKLAERAMHQLRTMLFDLRPVILETQGLVAALDAYAARLTQTKDFAVHFKIKGTMPELTKKANSALFAIIQEAIGNAKKHACASNIWLDLEIEGKKLTISVRDDGVGFDLDAVEANYASRGSLGLINMHERAELVNGTLSMDSAAGQGTTVQITVPLAPNLA